MIGVSVGDSSLEIWMGCYLFAQLLKQESDKPTLTP